jgi:hypothetical protein
MRRQVGSLRRAPTAHGFAVVSLSHPELEALGDHDAREQFQSLGAARRRGWSDARTAGR